MSLNDEDRMPPCSIPAEEAVLGACMLDPSCVPEVMSILTAADFFRDSHVTVFGAIAGMADRGVPVSALSVVDELSRLGDFDRAGGLEGLTDLCDRTMHAASAGYHARIVSDHARRRRLIAALRDSLEGAYSPQVTADEAIERAESRVFAVAGESSGEATGPASQHCDEAIGRLNRRAGGEVQGVPTGYVELDDTIDGLPMSGLIVLAARPSIGKTALALNIAENAVMGGNSPTLFVSLEMGGIEIGERLLVSRSRVDGHRIKTGWLRDGENAAIRAAAGEFRDRGRFWLDDSPGRTVSQIAANARRMKARHGIELLVVDYIQLIDAGSDTARASRQEQVSTISRRLKLLAKELRIPVLALSQLNRQSELREDRRPRLADLRESGSIEQDADIVLLLHRPEFYDPNDQPGLAELIVAKNRNGRTGSVKLAFLKSLARFESLAAQADVA